MNASVMGSLPETAFDGGVDDAQFRQRSVDVRALLLEFRDRLGGLVQHVLHLHGAALAVRAVEIEVVLDLGQRRADRLGAQDQLQPRAVAPRVDARAVDAARREQALVLVEAQRARRDVELPAELGDAEQLAGVVAAMVGDDLVGGLRAHAARGLGCLRFHGGAQTMRWSFSATLMSPETLNLPIMKPVVGSSSPDSRSPRVATLSATVQSATRSASLDTRLGTWVASITTAPSAPQSNFRTAPRPQSSPTLARS